MHARRLTMILMLLIGCGAGPDARAQASDAPTQTMTPDEAVEQLPPLLRLGFRVFQHRLTTRVIPEVVIVPDADRYLSAVSAWPASGRFPVLIDDGTVAARERIGRFVRAFGATRVVRWDGPTRAGDPIRARVDATVRAARAATGDTYRAPGLVVLSARDPAWTAGVALACAHAQPVLWVAPGEDPNAGMRLKDTDALSARIEEACAASGLSWRALGDDIDALTICLNLPGRTRVPKDSAGRLFLATTDLLGRHTVAGSTDRPDRWAWSGQIFGDASEAAYSAMCAVFLQTGRAWIVDSYPDDPPWNRYDGTLAAEQIEARGGAAVVTEWDDATPATWRRLSAMGLDEVPIGADGGRAPGVGIDAGLILVNSKGMRDEFHLRGRCRPGDVPFLRVPAMVHMVHSWSATRQADRKTVCGRWMERGVFAYAGSVEEPYLSAFQATPNVAYRLTRGATWGGAVRLDGAPAGRIAVIGDPLLVSYQRQSPRVTAPVPLQDTRPLRDLQPDALRDGRYTDALGVLVMRGMDSEAARLADALMAERPDELPSDAARLGLGAAARAGERPALIRLARRLRRDDAMTDSLRDAVWHTLWPTLRTLTTSELETLQWSLRDDQLARDGAEVVTAIRASGDDASGFIASMRDRLPAGKPRVAFDKAITR